MSSILLIASVVKADDGVHGGADVVGHIGKESALGAVGRLGGGNGIRKRLIHLFVGGAVGHDQDVFGPALHLAAYSDVMEPAALFGFQMLKLEIPFPLLPAEKPIQKVFALLRGAQLVQSMDILPDFSPRDAQKPLNVRADVIRLGGFCVQHQKNIVHVQRELLKQLVPVPDSRYLPAQGDMASAHNEQNGQHRKTAAMPATICAVRNHSSSRLALTMLTGTSPTIVQLWTAVPS